MIVVENLCRWYGPRQVLYDVSFTVKEGEAMGFLGPNGAGKTTTMRILCGLLAPHKGKINIAGYDVIEDSRMARKHIGYLPENPPIYEELTVREYLSFACDIHGIKGKKKKSYIDEAAGYCGLLNVMDRLLLNLSRGYRQRAALAQAIVHKPEVLILDEPTLGLDAVQITEIRSLIKGLKGKATIILSTHILPEVTATCDRVTIINEGKIVAVDTHEGLENKVRRHLAVNIKVKEGAYKLAEIVKNIDGVLKVETKGEGTLYVEASRDNDPRPKIIKKAVESGFELYEVSLQRLTLEDVFLKLVVKEQQDSKEVN